MAEDVVRELMIYMSEKMKEKMDMKEVKDIVHKEMKP